MDFSAEQHVIVLSEWGKGLCGPWPGILGFRPLAIDAVTLDLHFFLCQLITNRAYYQWQSHMPDLIDKSWRPARGIDSTDTHALNA